MREREQALDTVKALFTAHLRASSLPVSQTVYGTLFYKRADALRLQGFDRFGGRLFDFVLEPGRYQLRLPSEGRVMSGPPAELAGGGGIAEPVRLSLLAMSGLVGIRAVEPGTIAGLVDEGQEYRLDVSYPAPHSASEARLSRQIWFDRRTLQVIRERRFSPLGDVEGTLELGDFRRIESGGAERVGIGEAPLVLPFSITAMSAGGDARIAVTFSELLPNVPLTERDLRLAVGPPLGDNGGAHAGARS